MRVKKALTRITMAGLVSMFAFCGSAQAARIAIGPPASETNAVSQQILDAYGIKDYQPFHEGFGNAADLVQDGNVDISFVIMGVPGGSIESLNASTGDVKLLGLSDEVIAKLEEKSGYQGYQIPKDAYAFLDGDVPTIAAFAIMVANNDTIDEELGYQLAKIMVENAKEVTHAQGAQLTLQNALNGAAGIPIHPGAKRYYEEQGLKVEGPIARLKADPGKRKKEFTLGTGSQGGTYYPLGGEIANIWNKHTDSSFTNVETGASLENLATIARGRMDVGMSVHVPALDAVNGTGQFKGRKVENVSFLGHVYPEVVQIVTRKKTGINNLSDLAK
ncbi:TAXI family TRAP transporter solute-binding subunit [Oligella urethralis]|uniref:TAXI family TRAP transporter solute-binding subunit n=1 Tax=Oligella urethralis TaxID=90245 RepID=UPI000DFBF994|nr:TAXI family TRAP transporter solute-binding subunit [Oligella urethralis]MDK6202734.1 TAXI family TRAP transporter solute-binding subunit [Oligella urethralis]SUA64180.1 TRAP transporter solute receptor, TAXI family [Oligella urethralis]